MDWIVVGTHPLAGHYHSKAEFVAQTFEKLEIGFSSVLYWVAKRRHFSAKLFIKIFLCSASIRSRLWGDDFGLAAVSTPAVLGNSSSELFEKVGDLLA